MPKNHISNPYIGIIEMFESENRKSSNQNRKIEIGIFISHGTLRVQKHCLSMSGTLDATNDEDH